MNHTKTINDSLRRLVAVILILLFIFTSLVPTQVYAASTAKVTFMGRTFSYYSGGGKPTENLHGVFVNNYTNGTTHCAEHGIPAPTGETVGSSATLNIEVYNNELIAKILYYGWGGPGQWSGFANASYNSVYQLFSGNYASSKTEACGRSVTSMALTKTYNSYGGIGRSYDISGLSAFMSYVSSAPAVPPGFTVYKIDGGAWEQDLMTWHYVPHGYLTLQKSVTQQTGNSIAGAQYSVFSSSTLSGSSNVGTLTTKADGSTNTLTLPTGTYYVKETKAPTGWQLDPNTYTVTVSRNATYTVKSTESPNEGYLTLKKEIASNNHLVNECPEQYSLEGAKYIVATDQNGTNKVGELITKADGSTNTLTLVPGKYYVKEITAPKGFKIDSEVHPITVESGKTATVTSKEEPEFDPMTIVLIKEDANGTGIPLEGAEFTIKYYKELVDDVTGLTPARTWVFKTDSTGRIRLLDSYKVGGDELYKESDGTPAGLIGTYEITETKAPKGYATMESSVITHVTGDGAVDTTIYNAPTIKEYPQTVSITVQKVDALTGEAVPRDFATFSGAKYEVSKNGAIVGTITLNSSGRGTLGNLEPGEYEVKEVLAPSGYRLNDEVIKVNAEIKELNTANFDYVVESKEYPTQTVISKLDENGELLAGAKFQLLSEDGKRAITSWTSSASKAKTLYGLPAGKYILREIEAPQGYVKNNDRVINVNDDVGKVNISFRNFPTEASINKIDKTTGNTLAGVKMQIVNAQGTVVKSFTTGNYPTSIKKLPVGIYTLKEIETLPGYILADDVQFEIKNQREVHEVVMENDFTKVQFLKTDITTGQPVIGAKLELYNENGRLVETWITSENPHLIKKLPLGNYTLREASAPLGYAVSADVKFEVTETTDLQTVEMKDDYTKVEFIKYDISGQSKEPLAGVTMQLIDSKNNVVDEWITTTTAHRIDRLAEGTYTLREKATVPGYTIADDKVITVKKESAVQVFSMDNDTTKVEITKSDITTGELIAGAILQIIDKDDNVVHEWTTNGTAHQIEKLPLGEYILREILAPNGYVSAEDVKFIVDNTGNIQKVEMKDDYTKVEFIKYDISGQNKEPLAGVTMQLIDSKGDVVDEWVTTTTAHRIDRLKEGIYTLREKATVPGYTIADDKDITVKKESAVQVFSMDNDTTKVEFSKLDKVTNKFVEGVKLQILDNAGIVVKEWTTTDKAYFIEKLPLGDYTLREVEAPKGYTKASDIKFTVKNTGAKQNVVMYDDFTKAEFIKYDISGQNKEPLAGVTMQLIDDKSNVVDEWVTTTKAHRIERIAEGTYTLREKATVPGYTVADDKVIVINKESDVQVFTMDNDTTKVEFSKVDIANGTFVPGAKMQVIDKDGKVVSEWTTTDKAYFIEKLPLGDYTLREVEAPKGYVAAADINFTVENTGQLQKVEMKEDFTKLEISKTDITTGQPIIGAKLKIEDSEGNLVAEWTTSNTPFYIERIAEGEYTLTETFAPAGYVITNQIKFTVNKAGNIQKVEMKDDYTKVEFIKYDVSGQNKEPLAGVTMQLFDSTGKLVNEWLTSTKAHRIDRLAEGKYILKEKATVPGYTVAADKEITVKKEAAVQVFTMDNDTTKVEITKSDITTGKNVVGALLQILDKDGKVVTEWTTSDKPHFIEKLPLGDYTLREISAPDGYVKAEDVKFTVNNTGEIQKVLMEDDFTKLDISKTDITTGKNVAGAKLTIYPVKNDGTADTDNPYVSWVTDGKNHRVEYIPVGDYILREVLAPTEDGYVRAEDVKFTITETGVVQKVEMKDDYTKVVISKVDKDTKVGIPNTTLSLIPMDANGKLEDDAYLTVKTNAEGKISAEYVPVGKYVLREVGTNFELGYVTASDMIIEVKETSSTQSFTMEDEHTKVVVNKVDKDTKVGIPNTKLVILPMDKDGKVDETKPYLSATTDDKGQIKTEYIPVGKYIIREVGTNFELGYVTAGDVVMEVKDTSKEQSFTMEDDHTDILIEKIDSDTNEGIPNTKLSLIPIGTDGKVLEDKVFFTEITDKNGEIKSTYVPVGKYVIREVGTNFDLGYVTADDVIIEVKDTADVQKFAMKDGHTEILVTKIDKETKEPIEDTVLALIPLDVNGNPKTGETFLTKATNNKGQIKAEYIPVGKYIIREVGTNFELGYVTAEDMVIEVKDTDMIQEFTMEDAHTKITITKVDKDTKEPIIDTILSLIPLDEDGKPKVGETFLTATTDENGQIKAEYVPVGKYVLREMRANFELGYVTAEDMIIEIKDVDGQQSFVMEDDHTKLEITKTDIVTGEPVIGAQLSIIPLDEDGNLLLGETWATWITTEDPYYTEYLPAGDYILREIVAPFDDGYVTAQDIKFTVEDTGEIQKVEMVDDITKVEITKIDKETKKPLAGAKFELYDKDGKLVDSWTSTKEAYRIERLPIGTYTLKEVSAPEGYHLTDAVTFEVLDTPDIQKFAVDNEKIEIVPETGDNNNFTEYLGLGLIAGALLVITARKRKEEN